MNQILTGALAFVAVVGLLVTIFLGIAIISGKSDLLLVFSVGLVITIVSLAFLVRRKGGWVEFISNLTPWP